MVLYGKLPSPQVEQEIIETSAKNIMGLSWPTGGITGQPYFNKSTANFLIKGQLTQLLLTNPGERVMLPDYGVGLRQYLFEPLTSDISESAADEIMVAIKKYAKNIKVLSIRFFQDENLTGFGMPGTKISLTVSPKNGDQLLDVDIVI
tara:strand:+ start:295 stop:738 length:444 start_codon:yes stop_codon:yes gene_type:complete